MHRLMPLIISVALALPLGCAAPSAAGTPGPRFTREQAIERATKDAQLTRPEMGMIVARVDGVAAELITLGEADTRLQATRGPGGYRQGTDQQSPVWWVTVRGYFRYEGMAAPQPGGGRVSPVYEADEQRLVYYADTGEPVMSSVPSRPVATPTPPGSPPTTEAAGSATALEALGAFMEARVRRRDDAVLATLSEEFRRFLLESRDKSSKLYLLQASNPCWYRYEVLRLDQEVEHAATARVRVFEHQWGGDMMGSLPHSWEQEVSLAETDAGWRVNGLGEPQNRREAPDEPHGQTLSACNAAVPTPTPTPRRGMAGS